MTPTPNALAAVVQLVCVIYCRISKDPTGRRIGVDRQREDCLALAAELGWKVYCVLVDNDISAYSGKRRPDYHQLMDLIRTGAVQRVITWHPDRLHRSNAELEDYIELAWKKDVPLATKTGGYYDLSTSDARFKLRIDATVASRESEHRSERVTAAKLGLAKSGRWNGGARPFGYRRTTPGETVTVVVTTDGGDDREIEIDPAITPDEVEAPVVVDLANKFLRGVSIRSMAQDLNERGVPTAQGKGKWTAAHVSSLLSRPTLAGLRKHHDDLYPGVWQPILERGTWEAVQAVLRDPTRRSRDPSKGPTPQRLGTNIYRCGVCGQQTLRVSGGGRKRGNAYECGDRGNHVHRAAGLIDSYIEGFIVDYLSRPGIIAAAQAEANAGDGVEMVTLRAELVENEVAQGILATTGARPGITTAALLSTNASIDRLAVRANEIRRELAQAGTRSATEAIDPADVEGSWDRLSMGEKRAILSEVLDVTALPWPLDRKGRRPGGNYFEPEFIKIEERFSA